MNGPISKVEQLLTVREVAGYLKISIAAVYKFCDEGRLPYIDLGGEGRRRCLRFSPRKVDEFLRSRLVN